MSYHVEALCDRRKFGSATRKQIIMYLANKASDDGTGIGVQSTPLRGTPS